MGYYNREMAPREVWDSLPSGVQREVKGEKEKKQEGKRHDNRKGRR